MVHQSIENDKVAFMAKDYHHGARKYLVTLIYFKGGRDPPSHSRLKALAEKLLVVEKK